VHADYLNIPILRKTLFSRRKVSGFSWEKLINRGNIYASMPEVREMFKYYDCVDFGMGNMPAVQMLLGGREDLEWFTSNKEDLLTQYDMKFVAFCDKKILDSDADLEKLLTRLKRKGIDTSRVLIEFVSKVRSIL
jgi:hypothetical protein